MIQGGNGAGFRQITGRVGFSRDQPGVRYFDRDLALQLLVVTKKDHSETAFSQRTLDSVPTDVIGNSDRAWFLARIVKVDVGRWGWI
jgi:hypothetical protein